MSTNRTTKKARVLPKGPNGRNLCRWCQVEVKPPRLTFCSDACVHEHRLRSDPGYARARVLERDKGVCAICGIDTERHHRAYLRMRLGMRCRPGERYSDFLARLDTRIATFYRRTGFRVDGRGHAWEMDHIVPVVEGGGECGLDNLRTLCIACHKQVTAQLAAKRAERRKGQGPLPLEVEA